MDVKIVAFLQNQWFRNPEAVKAIYDRWPDKRESLNARFLFSGCLTGRRLKKAFGDLCDKIVWEEISTKVGGESNSVFPPDPEHIMGVLDRHKPEHVLVFGKVAQAALESICIPSFVSVIYYMPHPAARHAGVQKTLDAQAGILRNCLPSTRS